MTNPFRITIDTNPDMCNLHCIMCDTHSKYNRDFSRKRKSMSRELLENCLDQALTLGVTEIIPTTMGEPLLYEHFDLFIERLKGTDTKLNLTTNGTFPRYGTEKWARLLMPVLSDIKISINGIDAVRNESIMNGDNTSKKINDIKIFAKIRDELESKATITLQVTFMNSNLSEMRKIIEFALENNIDRVKGHHLWVNWKELADQAVLSSVESIKKWNELVRGFEKYRPFIKLVNFEPIEANEKDTDMPLVYNCPFLGKELWIDHNGDYNICCAPSEKRKSLGYWGNISETEITDLFNSDKYIQLTKDYKMYDICKRCPLRRKDA